ncbi:MAG TPA: PDR/VanB family oxidoreductase [Burkholderiaceae bacterium]|nr:PDR/VanB family oxidoreductase [Burkholderiaceae bacterium]
MTERLALQVADVRAEARDVVLLELRAAGGAALPAFEPGAHLEVELPNGLLRHYSLCNDWRERERYLVGVGRAVNGRGGSQYIHQHVRRGMSLKASAPRNNFALDPEARGFVFVAGGIGITPINAMVQWCEANRRPWRLVYAVRSRQRAAFYETLRELPDRVQFHFDDENAGLLDVGAALAGVERGEQIYCCGPAPLVKAVREATAHLPEGTVKFEFFTAPADSRSDTPQGAAADGAFRIELRRSGQTLDVPAGQSILEVLERHGHEVPFSCREGLCRTCETSIVAGACDHRDYVLSADERQAGKSLMVCVSRSLEPLLVLDL